MHRKFLFPLAAGILGLVAISPALANEPSKTPPAKKSTPAKAKSTTSTTAADPGAADDSGSAPDGSAPDDSGSAPDGSGSAPDGNGASGNGGKNGSSGNSAPSSGGGQRSTSVCDPPVTNQSAAPQMGDAPQSYEAGEAGSVDVERLSDTELRVAKATPSDGWTEQVATPSGPRITVKFTRQGQSPSLIRFAASMDQKGTMIHVRVTSCG
jgi:hypothetical protein